MFAKKKSETQIPMDDADSLLGPHWNAGWLLVMKAGMAMDMTDSLVAPLSSK